MRELNSFIQTDDDRETEAAATGGVTLSWRVIELGVVFDWVKSNMNLIKHSVLKFERLFLNSGVCITPAFLCQYFFSPLNTLVEITNSGWNKMINLTKYDQL